MRVASLPDAYIDHADRARQLAGAGLDADSLYQLASQIVTAGQSRSKQDNR